MEPLNFIMEVFCLALVGHGFAALIQWTTFMSKVVWPVLRHLVPDGVHHAGYQAWKDEAVMDERPSRHFIPDLVDCHYCLSFWGALTAGLLLTTSPLGETLAASLAASALAVFLCRLSNSLTR